MNDGAENGVVPRRDVLTITMVITFAFIFSLYPLYQSENLIEEMYVSGFICINFAAEVWL